MKKWAIVDCSANKVLHIYESEEAKDSTKYWNYTWTSEGGVCKHHEFSPSLEATALSDLTLTELEMADVEIQVGTQRIPDGDPQPAKDANGDPIEDQNGDPIMVQDYKEVPVMETQKRVVLKAE